MSDDQIHSKLILPYIKVLSDMTKKRFDDKTTKMCIATSTFDPSNIPTGNVMYGSSQLSDMASLHPNLSSLDIQDEWKTFQNYLKCMQSSKQIKPSGKEILQRL